jgi:hypothetical protein
MHSALVSVSFFLLCHLLRIGYAKCLLSPINQPRWTPEGAFYAYINVASALSNLVSLGVFVQHPTGYRFVNKYPGVLARCGDTLCITRSVGDSCIRFAKLALPVLSISWLSGFSEE